MVFIMFCIVSRCVLVAIIKSPLFGFMIPLQGLLAMAVSSLWCAGFVNTFFQKSFPDVWKSLILCGFTGLKKFIFAFKFRITQGRRGRVDSTGGRVGRVDHSQHTHIHARPRARLMEETRKPVPVAAAG